MWVCCPPSRAGALIGIRAGSQGPGGWTGGQALARVGVRPGPGFDLRGWLVKPGLERAHAKPGSGKGPIKSGSGTRAGQIRNGKGRQPKNKIK